MPYFRGEPYPHLHRYAHLGSSLGDILLTLILKPWRWIGVVLTPEKLAYLLALLLPLGGLPLLGPRALVAAFPPLAVNLLTFDHALFHYRSQYQAFVLPFLMLAAVDGYARLRPHRKAGTVLALAFLASAVLTARTANDLMVTRWRLGPEQQAAHELMERIPAGVPVSVNERLVPHLATRREVFIYPTGVGRSFYVLDHESVLSARPATGYREIGHSRGWILLQLAPVRVTQAQRRLEDQRDASGRDAEAVRGGIDEVGVGQHQVDGVLAVDRAEQSAERLVSPPAPLT
jgi:uncharacterized membrane protein